MRISQESLSHAIPSDSANRKLPALERRYTCPTESKRRWARMRTFRSLWLAALLCLTATLASAQKSDKSRKAQIYVPSQRVPMNTLPPPQSDAHGHPPDNRTG